MSIENMTNHGTAAGAIVAARPARGRRSARLRRAGALTALLAIPLMAAAPNHITPTVVLRKQADVIRATLPGASHFFVKTVQIGRGDLARIEREGGFKPEEPKVRFYYGQDGSGAMQGVVLFPQVNTQHGPFEVGLTVAPDGTVLSARVTKATVETKPWVEKAIATGFLADFHGLAPGQPTDRAVRRLQAGDIGRMPTFAGEEIAAAVQHGLALYNVLYGVPSDGAGGDGSR